MVIFMENGPIIYELKNGHSINGFVNGHSIYGLKWSQYL